MTVAASAPVATPVVAIVGRPNVGKSTLVNRIVGRREAVVDDVSGVTRDRKQVAAEWAGRAFTLVDTGGWLAGGNALDHQVSRQVEKAIATADLVLLVVDTQVGITDEDERVARMLRRMDRPVLVVANKVDAERREVDMWDFVGLGLGDPLPVSAIHGRGAGDLLDRVVQLLPPSPDAPTPAAGPVRADGSARADRPVHLGGPVHARTGDGADADGADANGAGDTGDPVDSGVRYSVAIVGRPNVGKSTLFNRLVGEDRSVVHDLAGTTRDAIDTVVETDDGPVRFVDTAGLRRRSKQADGPEYYSLVRALQAIDRADTALLVIDATEGVTHQDQRLAERVDAAGSPVVLVLNKWETLNAESRADVIGQMADRLGFLAYAPVLKVSALTGLGVHKLLGALGQAVDAYHQRVPTGVLNRVIQSAQSAHPPPSGRIQYITQGGIDPPTFTLFATRALPAPYLRYLERKIREHFAFGPTPLKLRVRRRSSS